MEHIMCDHANQVEKLTTSPMPQAAPHKKKILSILSITKKGTSCTPWPPPELVSGRVSFVPVFSIQAMKVNLASSHSSFVHENIGFKADDIKIRVDDDSRKLKVKGRRHVGQATVERFEHDFDVPRDADLERVGGRFQHGWLSVIMPKKKKIQQETESQEEDKKTKEEEPVLQEKPASGQHKAIEKPIDGDRIKQRHFPNGTPAGGDTKHEEETAKSRIESGEKPESCCTDKDGRKEGVSWMQRMEEMEEWVDSQLVDKLLEGFNKNRKVIAAAAVGFSIGFYVSLKLRSSGR
ncbi:hypothetical protein BHM03_00007264 [Ensete ventricosum]|nr:hypothetical protein BHM03_00007264 [Ensete ventricosum]